MNADILILGLGWQGQYILEQCVTTGTSVIATTTTGRSNTIQFKFDKLLPAESYTVLPKATTVIITFPLPTSESLAILTDTYNAVKQTTAKFILLGSTRCWHGTVTDPWANREGPLTPDARYNVEEWMIQAGGCVLNLAGLWGGARHPRDWISRVAKTKEELEAKTSVHLIHGIDVARLVIEIHRNFTVGQRWIVTDLRVYDWWELVLGFEVEESERIRWVHELLATSRCFGLPREPKLLKRCLDSKNVWINFGILPLQSLYKK